MPARITLTVEKKKVLYVDDEPALCSLTKIFLEKTGYFSVKTAISAKEGYLYIGMDEYDAIVSDYQMPEVNGIEFLKVVREKAADLPFILFTGKGREEVAIEAIDNGADFYLQKGGDPVSQFAELSHKIGMAIDRKHALEALKDSEQQLSGIINFLPDATFAIDRDGRVIAWNHAIEEMTGIPASDMVGKGDHEYALPFYGDRRPMLIDLLSAPDSEIARYYSQFVHRKTSIVTADAIHLPAKPGLVLMASAGLLFDRNGGVAGAIESIRDVSDLKNVENDLARTKKDWETIFRAVGHPAMVLDMDNRVIDANDTTLRVTGMSLEGLMGRRCYEVFHGGKNARPPERCPFEQMKQDEQVKSVETEVPALDGYYSVSCTPVYNASGELEKVIHIALDVTARKRAEDELKAAYEQLAASQEELQEQFQELSRNEQRIRENESRLLYHLSFYDMAKEPEKEILDCAVEGAGAVTGSPLAYLAFLNEDESELTMYAWSQTAMKECAMREKPIVYKTEQTGLWGEAVRQRQPVITNDYQADSPMKKGYPKGHPHIIRHMNIPVMDGDHVVIVAGVANKYTEYTEEDVKQLSLLMHGLWEVLRRKRAEEALAASEEKYRRLASDGPGR
jgi:PAS domain S-box-containing protein